MIDLQKAANESFKIAVNRMKNGAKIDVDTIAMLKHCAGEIVEAAEAYNEWDMAAYIDSENLANYKEKFMSEIGDILCCALIISGAETFNPEEIILNTIEKNRLRSEGKGDKK